MRENTKHTIEEIKRGHPVSDWQFDRLYEQSIRQYTQRHWTPFDVAARAARLLVTGPETRVLDVGSGAGKFCLIGALTTPGTFHGIEQREKLVAAARQVADTHGISRTAFIHGPMTAISWADYDAFYFYNPFYENLAPSVRIDRSVEFSEYRYQRHVRIVRTRLDLLPAGSRVATYHGLGGEMPPSYRSLKREVLGSGELELWIKSAGAAQCGYRSNSESSASRNA